MGPQSIGRLQEKKEKGLNSCLRRACILMVQSSTIMYTMGAKTAA